MATLKLHASHTGLSGSLFLSCHKAPESKVTTQEPLFLTEPARLSENSIAVRKKNHGMVTGSERACIYLKKIRQSFKRASVYIPKEKKYKEKRRRKKASISDLCLHISFGTKREKHERFKHEETCKLGSTITSTHASQKLSVKPFNSMEAT